MRFRPVPHLAIAFYIAMAIALTYPGYVPFNRIRPFILGLPFSLVWQGVWIAGTALMLAGVFFWERRRTHSDRGDE